MAACRRCRARRLPSGRAIRPRKCSASPDSVACPAIGVLQEPSSSARKARSQAIAVERVGVIDARENLARARVVRARLDADGALRRPPAEIHRHRHDRGRVLRRGRAASSRRAPEWWRRLRRRRACAAASRHCRAAARPAGRAAARLAMACRRSEAVPRVAPCGSSASDLALRLMKTSRGSSRSRQAASISPGWRERSACPWPNARRGRCGRPAAPPRSPW